MKQKKKKNLRIFLTINYFLVLKFFILKKFHIGILIVKNKVQIV